MFDFLFGWRKASKCKKLIRRVQCRLKLMHKKRCCVVKQLRQDVADLLNHGHERTAFDRVEQVIKDETLVQAYDLLTHFCEFIIINLPYIRKHKDCPNDINEAVSTLIFSSARFGELPELLSVRKLFGERYGQRFVMASIELLPGNLVNNQIIESLYIKHVPDDEKYRMLEEIARSCHQPGPLLLDCKPFWQEEEKLPNLIETEVGKIVHVDVSSEINKVPKEIVSEKEFVPFDGFGGNEIMIGEESSSENSARLPQVEIVYLDDIEEVVSPGLNLEDQRLFVFKSFAIPFEKDGENHENSLDELNKTSGNEDLVSRSSRKTSRATRKRTRRRRSVSLEKGRSVIDIECAIYYGDSDENPSDHHCNHKSYNQRWRRNKTLFEESQKSHHELGQTNQKDDDFLKKGDIVDKCSLDRPCYDFCVGYEKGSCWIPKMKSSKIVHSLVQEKIKYGLEFDKGSCREEEEENGTPNCLRTMTMTPERPDENDLDNIVRSNSFPIEQPRDRHSSCRHIHPKLPDYDELAEMFMALKRENMKNKRLSNNIGDQKI